MKQLCWILLIVAAATSLFGQSVQSAMPTKLTTPPEAQPSAHFDVEAATNAYLAEMPPAARARSDAYFEGGYWLLLFGVVRRLPRTWWLWGSLVTFLFLIFVILIGPVYILPLFNKVTPLNDPALTQRILRLARANGIPARDVFMMDASKQTTRMSANVSGFGNTMRITLNDNLLRRGSPEEIEAVMGHEMGHYVLNHVYKGLLFFLVLIVTWFAALFYSLQWALNRWGARWQIRGVGDTAVLPLVLLITSIFFFVLTPVLNTYVRTQEAEADIYGINASRQPDGFAQAAIHLGEYRKMSPGPA